METANRPPLYDVVFFAEMEATPPIQIAMPRKTALLIVDKLSEDAAQAGALVPCVLISPTSIEGRWGGYPMRVLPAYDNSEVLMIGIYDGARPMDIFYPRKGWINAAPVIHSLLETVIPTMPCVHIGFIGGLLCYGATPTPDIHAIIEQHYLAMSDRSNH